MSYKNCEIQMIGDHHPTGMLDRDQRTIIIPKFKEPIAIATTVPSCTCNCDCVDSNQIVVNCDKRQIINYRSKFYAGVKSVLEHDVCKMFWRRRKHTMSSMKKTNDNLLFCCIWLLALILPATYCKPFEHHSPSPTSNLHFILTHPFGLMEEATNSDSNDQFTDADLKEMLHVIAQQTSNALNEADVSVKKYLEIVWDRTDIEAFSKSWQYRQQNWLYPDGKKLDELFHDGDTVDMKSVDEEKLSVYANITKLLVDADNRFQRLIIGFHKIISKQEDLKSRRLTDNRVIDLFSMSLKNLIMVRREVLTLSDKLRLKRTDISENVMSDEDLSDDLFDWIILREYVNQLKYLKKSIDILSFNKVYLQSNFL